MPKALTPRAGRRHNPLDADLLARDAVKQKAPKRKSRNLEDGNGYVDAGASRRILELGRELRIEGDEEAIQQQQEQESIFALRPDVNYDVGREQSPFADDIHEEPWVDEENNRPDDDDEQEDYDLDPRLEKALDDEWARVNASGRSQDLGLGDRLRLDSSSSGAKKTETQDGGEGEQTVSIGDILWAKLKEIDAEEERQKAAARRANDPDAASGDDFHMDEDDEEPEIDPKLVEAFTLVGSFLSTYKSGPLPKLLRTFTRASNWERMLEISEPEKWTPHACLAMTKIFVSSGYEESRTFNEAFLLDRVRDDIQENKVLSHQLFLALKKALFRPQAFFLGILFPLVRSRTTTRREALVIRTAMVQHTIPVLHGSAAILELCKYAATEEPDSPQQTPVNVFIMALLEKNYAMPYPAIDALVDYFWHARTAENMHVLWHQSFLKFAELYRDALTEEQRELLLDLLLRHNHHSIGPNIRRELVRGRNRVVEAEKAPAPVLDEAMQLDASP